MPVEILDGSTQHISETQWKRHQSSIDLSGRCVLQVWLQEFAWTEEEKPVKVARRNSSLPPGQVAGLQKEPMFCVETMMCCLYWSLLAYDYQDVSHTFVFAARLLSILPKPGVFRCVFQAPSQHWYNIEACIQHVRNMRFFIYCICYSRYWVHPPPVSLSLCQEGISRGLQGSAWRQDCPSLAKTH